MNTRTLYERLGGYDAIAAVVNDLMPRLRGDSQIGRFWQHRADDSLKRSKQHLIDFLSSSAGGPVYYAGRDMDLAHKGMGISESDWSVFSGHLDAVLEALQVPHAERAELDGLVQGTKNDMVEK
jgi:hemoglobin